MASWVCSELGSHWSHQPELVSIFLIPSGATVPFVIPHPPPPFQQPSLDRVTAGLSSQPAPSQALLLLSSVSHSGWGVQGCCSPSPRGQPASSSCSLLVLVSCCGMSTVLDLAFGLVSDSSSALRAWLALYSSFPLSPLPAQPAPCPCYAGCRQGVPAVPQALSSITEMHPADKGHSLVTFLCWDKIHPRLWEMGEQGLGPAHPTDSKPSVPHSAWHTQAMARKLLSLQAAAA